MNLEKWIYNNKKSCFIIFIMATFILYFMLFKKVDEESNLVNSSLQKISIYELLRVSISAAENGGIEVTKNAKTKEIHIKGKTLEGAEERVTLADYKSHCVMKNTIKKQLTDIKLVSEESKANCDKILEENNIKFKFELPDMNLVKDVFVNKSDLTIWIDPLDATQEFTDQLYEYVTTMVCVSIKGKPAIGVIHKPFLKETYWGLLIDNYKSSNLKPIYHSKKSKKVVVISRSHSGKVKSYIDNKLINFKKSVIEAGGSGYKVVEIIKGNADIYLHTTEIKKWDICAGNALLLSVGGNMTTLKNELINYEDIKNYINKDGLLAYLKENSESKRLLN